MCSLHPLQRITNVHVAVGPWNMGTFGEEKTKVNEEKVGEGMVTFVLATMLPRPLRFAQASCLERSQPLLEDVSVQHSFVHV
jgi:hypothetical protein